MNSSDKNGVLGMIDKRNVLYIRLRKVFSARIAYKLTVFIVK